MRAHRISRRHESLPDLFGCSARWDTSGNIWPASSVEPGVVKAEVRIPHLPLRSSGNGPVISFTRSGLAVPWDNKFKSLLELAEACDVPVRWSCRSGVCHMCECGLLSGKLHYSPEPLDEPATGNALICCSTPESEVDLDL